MSEINKNKPGYKHTPLGWIPEDWKIKSLSDDIENLDAGVSVNSINETPLNGEPAILKTSAVNGGYFYPEQKKKIIAEDINRAKLNPTANSIIISRMNTPELVGECGYVEKAFENIFLPDRLWQTRFYVESNINVQWLNYLLNESRYKSKIKGVATGTSNSMKNISKEAFLNMTYICPSNPEQQKIAAILSTWDEAITKTQQLIAQLQQRNKGLMQQLLTGKKRLKEFEEFSNRLLPINSFAKEVSEKNKEDKELIVLSCTKYNGLVPSLEYFGRKIYSDDLTTYKIVSKKCFAYATNHIEEGSIGYQSKYEEALISPMYTVFKTDDLVNDEYLFKVLKSHHYIHEYQKRMEGSIDRRGGLRWDEFSKIKVLIPAIEEQKAIAGILNNADDEVKLNQQKLSTLQQQKKGLMQKLLTGEVRVKI